MGQTTARKCCCRERFKEQRGSCLCRCSESGLRGCNRQCGSKYKDLDAKFAFTLRFAGTPTWSVRCFLVHFSGFYFTLWYPACCLLAVRLLYVGHHMPNLYLLWLTTFTPGVVDFLLIRHDMTGNTFSILSKAFCFPFLKLSCAASTNSAVSPHFTCLLWPRSFTPFRINTQHSRPRSLVFSICNSLSGAPLLSIF